MVIHPRNPWRISTENSQLESLVLSNIRQKSKQIPPPQLAVLAALACRLYLLLLHQPLQKVQYSSLRTSRLPSYSSSSSLHSLWFSLNRGLGRNNLQAQRLLLQEWCVKASRSRESISATNLKLGVRARETQNHRRISNRAFRFVHDVQILPCSHEVAEMRRLLTFSRG